MMKKYLWLILLIPLLFGFRATRMISSHAGGGVPAAGGGGYTEEETDDMSNASTPPSGWTESSGSWTKTGGTLYRDADQANDYIRYSTAMGSVNHYLCVTVLSIDEGSEVPGVSFRMTTSTSDDFYIIRNVTNSNTLDFRLCDSSPASCYTFHQVTSYADTATNDVICGGVEGTGVNTVFYYWENPGDDPPVKGSADYTINSANWDNAPTAGGGKDYADTGTFVGIADMHSSQVPEYDDFSAGSE